MRELLGSSLGEKSVLEMFLMDTSCYTRPFVSYSGGICGPTLHAHFAQMIMLDFVKVFGGWSRRAYLSPAGARGLEDLKRAIVDHVESASSRPLHWPNLQPLV